MPSEHPLNNINFEEQFDPFDPDTGIRFELDAGESFDSSMQIGKEANFKVDFTDSDAIDSTFRSSPKRYRIEDRQKAASILRKAGFVRVAKSNKLINKSTKDLWALTFDKNGTVIIEQLFGEEDEPLTDTI